MTLPRVASGRCKVAVVGMRLDARAKGAARLEAWAVEHGLTYLGAIRESQAYPRAADQGLTLFDLPPAKVQADLAQWRPVVDWVDEAWQSAERAEAAAKASVPAVKAASISPSAKRRPGAPAPSQLPRTWLPEGHAPREVLRQPRAARLGWLLDVFRART
jgi:chromosome partitioning protein